MSTGTILSNPPYKVVFGTLDSKPVNDYNARVKLGTEFAIGYNPIRDHKKHLSSGPNDGFPTGRTEARAMF